MNQTYIDTLMEAESRITGLQSQSERIGSIVKIIANGYFGSESLRHPEYR
ncbi:MAG: hypothetical protein HFE63_03790 [Clostridiales bacterium]|nr:hypothetical protein [Clostridiales bacterium]